MLDDPPPHLAPVLLHSTNTWEGRGGWGISGSNTPLKSCSSPPGLGARGVRLRGKRKLNAQNSIFGSTPLPAPLPGASAPVVPHPLLCSPPLKHRPPLAVLHPPRRGSEELYIIAPLSN